MGIDNILPHSRRPEHTKQSTPTKSTGTNVKKLKEQYEQFGNPFSKNPQVGKYSPTQTPGKQPAGGLRNVTAPQAPRGKLSSISAPQLKTTSRSATPEPLKALTEPPIPAVKLPPIESDFPRVLAQDYGKIPEITSPKSRPLPPTPKAISADTENPKPPLAQKREPLPPANKKPPSDSLPF